MREGPLKPYPSNAIKLQSTQHGIERLQATPLW